MLARCFLVLSRARCAGRRQCVKIMSRGMGGCIRNTRYLLKLVLEDVFIPGLFVGVILTIVCAWGNQWAPGETSVPFWFVWSTAFLGGIFPIILLP